MMTAKPDMRKVSEAWIRILNKMDACEKEPYDFGSGIILYCSEIHTIMAIGNNPDSNITNLAFLLGISKSAISQMVTRLGKKGLVERYRDSGNDKETRIRLTPRGTIAYLGHEQHHARISAGIHQRLGELTDDQFTLIIRLLSAVEETIDECCPSRE